MSARSQFDVLRDDAALRDRVMAHRARGLSYVKIGLLESLSHGLVLRLVTLWEQRDRNYARRAFMRG